MHILRSSPFLSVLASPCLRVLRAIGAILARRAGVLGMAVIMSGCGGGGGGGSSEPQPPAPPAAGMALVGSHVVKLRAQGDNWIALAEAAQAHVDNTAPDRHLVRGQQQPGGSPVKAYSPPPGWSLIDAALHPSGEASLVLGTARQLRLVRLDAQSRVIADEAFTDPQAVVDPIYSENGVFVHDSQSLLPMPTRDTARLAVQGENLVMALRTGRHAVVAYGLSLARGSGFRVAWRTLIEPGVYIAAQAFRGGGTSDPFASMEKQFHVHLDTDAQGRIAIGVMLDQTDLAYGHHRHFGDAAVPSHQQSGVLLTQLSAQGDRQHTTLINTVGYGELHGVRWAGAEIAAVGRVLTQRRAEGDGWNAFVGMVPAQPQPAPAVLQVLDFDRGDLIFDVARLDDGRLLLAGSTGYLQNPSGRSVTEEAQPLLAVASADGRTVRRVAAQAGPRHNQVRALARWQGRWWAGGMEDGPGTHSDDANPAGVRANGFVRPVPSLD